MLNKLNSKVLVLILAVLAAATIYVMVSKEQSPKSTLPEYVLTYDSSQVNRLVVAPKEGDAYELKLDNGSWKLALGAKLVAIESEALQSAISTISKAKPKRVVSRKEENWPNYEVNEEAATVLKLYRDEEVLAGVVVGKFDFNQQKRSMHTFVRPYDANDVYMVEGAIAFDWNKQASDWRNKKLISVNTGDIQKIDVQGQNSFGLIKSEEQGWMVQGIDLDSAGIEKYLGGISNITSPDFNDDVEASQLGTPQLTVEVYTDTENVTFSWYSAGGVDVVQSSANPGSLFNISPELAAKLIPVPSTAPAEE